MTDTRGNQRQIDRNIATHNRVAKKHASLHGELFNDVEQARLREALQAARDSILSGGQPLEALDLCRGPRTAVRW